MEDTIQQEKTELIAKLKETVGNKGICTPLNIAFIGTPGCGKSSFINSFAASISDECWREYAFSGKKKCGGDHQNTVRLQSLAANNYGASPNLRDCSLPTLIDMTGFQSGGEEIIQEILRLIFYGKLKNTSNANSVFRFAKTYGIWALRLWYGLLCPENYLKIDRVVFVALAKEEVPQGLISSVMKAARPADDIHNREIPVFGVMTGIDLVDESHTEGFEETKINFMNSLALMGVGHRFLQCENYCDEVDPTRKRICQTLPRIDVPILKFMNVVCGRNYGVTNSEESYRDVLRSRLGHVIRSWIMNACRRVTSSFTDAKRNPIRIANLPGFDMGTVLLCLFVCVLFCMVLLNFRSW